MRTPIAASLVALALVACRDDPSGTGGAGQGGGPGAGGGSVGSTTSTSTGQGGTTDTSSSTGGDGGAGGSQGCPNIPIGDGQSTDCSDPGPLTLTASGSVGCTSDPSVAWPVAVYTVEVNDGDCLHMRADDAGTSGGVDLFGAMVDPNGDSLIFDDELDCSVEGASSFGCPDGGIIVVGTGTAYVMVGAWESPGCPSGGSSSFSLAVSVNGTDVASSSLCSGDLVEIIP